MRLTPHSGGDKHLVFHEELSCTSLSCTWMCCCLCLLMFIWKWTKTDSPLAAPPPTQQDTTLEAHVKANGPLTLSVGEVEEQTQDKQQRQQQRGSGSVHGGTAWHQHALAASVALAHRALWVSLVWFLRCRVFTAYARQGGMGRGREKGRERERGSEWNKAVWLHGFYLSLHISDIPPHSLGWSWQRIGRGWCAHRVCSDSSLNGIVTSHNACARVHERESDRECRREREKPHRWKGGLIRFCLHSFGGERQLNTPHNKSTF